MARREERIDAERLARLESGTGDRIRVPLPNRKVNEMFAIADVILGGRRVRSICEDGQTRLARIPGKMRRRQWVREGDLITLQPWEFQDEKANVCMRYTKTQSLYLSRKGVLPEIVDLFGMSEDSHLNSEEKTEINEQEDDDTTVSSESEVIKEPQITPSIMENDADDDIDSFFG
jgi:translation initiation factor 1A